MRALYERPTQLRRFPDGDHGRGRSTRSGCPRSGPSGSRRRESRSPRAGTPTSSASRRSRRWPGRRTSPWSTSTRGRRADVTPSIPTSSASTSTRSRARLRRRRGGSRRLVREMLAEIGYVGWPKTSGNRGIHIACRIEPQWEFPVVRRGRARVRPRDRAAPAAQGHDRLVEGAAWQARLHRLQPECSRPHDRVGLLGARPLRRNGVGAGDLGRAPRRAHRGLHDGDDARPLRRARRRAVRDRRRCVRPARPARMGRARRARRSRRSAVPAQLPQDARRAAARAAVTRTTGSPIGWPSSSSPASWNRA